MGGSVGLLCVCFVRCFCLCVVVFGKVCVSAYARFGGTVSEIS